MLLFIMTLLENRDMETLSSGTPLVSIITPSYNSKNYFLETFNSVISQTYTNWEWIIVDDCSTDGSFEYIQDLIKEHDNITLLKTSTNSGAAVSRNVAIKIAKGDFIAFVDSDDCWEFNKLERQIEFMLSNDYVFTCTNYYVKHLDGKITNFTPRKKIQTYKSLLDNSDIGCLTVMYNASKIGKIYMPEDSYKREDYAAWLDITKMGYKCYCLNEFLSTYRLLSNSVSANKLKLIKYNYRVYRRHEKFGFFKSLYYITIHSIARLFKTY